MLNSYTLYIHQKSHYYAVIKIFTKVKRVFSKAHVTKLTEPVTNGDGSVRDVMAYITIAAAILIGAYILGMFVQIMPQLNESNPFHDLMNNISNVISSGYGILVIVLIVIAFVIILGYLMRIGQNGNN